MTMRCSSHTRWPASIRDTRTIIMQTLHNECCLLEGMGQEPCLGRFQVPRPVSAPVTAKIGPGLAPAKFETQIFDQPAVAIRQLIPVGEHRLQLLHFDDALGCRGIGAVMQGHEVIQRTRPAIHRHGQVLAEMPHDTDKTDFVRLRVLYAEELAFGHPLPGSFPHDFSCCCVKLAPLGWGRIKFGHHVLLTDDQNTHMISELAKKRTS